ncbi:hypothetical protein SDRG_10293 [Saprolegnia diclina VS20]|uniref:ATPase AAA-type core domain-containing protein n=1 Tax=Saprolegnia diclina (strain VS20) TaxID=1156394 RepID=T0RQ11_SAPDV|nr:hypothetical protein SDRG_10293 [Saprolegnia diclina VS20]EQC32097.1 hypothetical protein SDRG_10293 [Saprolegnia diclina VS20]|eukprot:XP_008614499.1 hypothetical protein SDRG_10293 [Saprolegnia diclina VS20]
MRGVARWLQQAAPAPAAAGDVEAIESEPDDDEFVDGKSKRPQAGEGKKRKPKPKPDDKGQLRLSFFCQPPTTAPEVANTASVVNLAATKSIEIVTLDESIDCIEIPDEPAPARARRAAKRKPSTTTDASSSEDTVAPVRAKRRVRAKPAKKATDDDDDGMEIWSPEAPTKRKDAFFLTPQQRDAIKTQEALVREQEALLKFQIDLEKRKALDMAFYAHKTTAAVNPFFQKAHPTAKAPIVVDGDDAPTSIIKWSKEPMRYPPGHLWHVNRPPPVDTPLQPLPVGPKVDVPIVVEVDDGSSPPWRAFAADHDIDRLHEHMQDEALYVHSAATLDGDLASSVSSAQRGRWVQALKSRRDDSGLLSVDRFAPTSFNGVVGSKESVVALYQWLRAWKTLRSGRQPDRSSYMEFFMDPEYSDDDEEDTELYRLLVLQGEAGAGKTCSVYACAAELGYQVLEINAGQLRSGKTLLELAGEATQSSRVLASTSSASAVASGNRPLVDVSRVLDEDFYSDDVRAKKDAKRAAKEQTRKKKSKKKKQKEDFTSAKTLSLVLLEDVDVLFDADKGFLSALSQMARQSKCPIIATCTQLPENFPSHPPYLLRQWRRPTAAEFTTYLALMSEHEQWALPPSAMTRLHRLFRGDLRRTLHFLDFNQPLDQPWTHVVWRPYASRSHDEDDEKDEKDAPMVDLTEGVPLLASAYTASGVDVLHTTYLTEWRRRYGDEVTEGPASWAENNRPSRRQCDDMDAVALLADAVSDSDVWLRTDNDEGRRVMAQGMRSMACDVGFALGDAHETSLDALDGIDLCSDAFEKEASIRRRQAELGDLVDALHISMESSRGIRRTRQGAVDTLPFLSVMATSDSVIQQVRRRSLGRTGHLAKVISDSSLIATLQDRKSYH